MTARSLAAVVAVCALPGLTACSAWSETSGRRAASPAGRDSGAAREVARKSYPPIRWQRSRSLGLAYSGRLVNGVQLPPEGRDFFTWDPIRERKPNRGWRRYGSDRLIRTVLRVLAEYRAANPDAPRVAVGDVSRPRGGDFGPRFGLPGHASHQNGLDVDIYYPRKDGLELAPSALHEVDRRLAQELVDRFVRAGAQFVFVGLRVGLTGPPKIVQRLAYHDDHLHVRLLPDPPGRTLKTAPRTSGEAARAHYVLGRSQLGRAIRATRRGRGATDRTVLAVGCVHGTECAGVAVTKLLARRSHGVDGDLWLVHNLNPDGLAAGTRQNGRGVDLNRNFPSEWRPLGRRWDPQYSGPRPLSERETRIARALIVRLRPAVTIWFHQPQALVRAWGGSVPAARRYARLARVPLRAIRWPAGTAPNWQNHRFPRASSFVVELPPGRLSRRETTRHANAVLHLANDARER